VPFLIVESESDNQNSEISISLNIFERSSNYVFEYDNQERSSSIFIRGQEGSIAESSRRMGCIIFFIQIIGGGGNCPLPSQINAPDDKPTWPSGKGL
jgi:hypothetical protein